MWFRTLLIYFKLSKSKMLLYTAANNFENLSKNKSFYHLANLYNLDYENDIEQFRETRTISFLSAKLTITLICKFKTICKITLQRILYKRKNLK